MNVGSLFVSLRYYLGKPNEHGAVASSRTAAEIDSAEKTEAALSQSELRLRCALDAGRMGTFEADIAGSEAIIDAQEAHLLGLPAETRVVPTEELRARIPFEDLQASDAKKARLEQDEEAYHHEFRLHMPDGSQRWLSAYAAIREGRIFGVNFDVTERKRAEAALAESESRLRVAVNAAALGVFERDVMADRTIWINDRIYEIFGRSRADGPLSTQQFVENYLHPNDAPVFEAALNHAMRTGDSLHTVCRIRRKDGSQRWLQMDGTYELAITGEPLRFVGVVADITEHKALEREAKELSERMVTLQEDERQRIAQELHDSTAQHLVAANLNLMNLRSKVAVGSDAERLCDEVAASMHEALKEIRSFSYLMHPPALFADGLHSTIRQYLDGYAERSGLSVKLRSSPMVDNLPFQMQRSLFRVAQEAVANVQRHASASHVFVDLRWINGRLHLIVTDDGRGSKVALEREDSPPRGGLGISGIKARAQQFGGQFKMRTGPRGTTIHVATPVDRAHGRRATSVGRGGITCSIPIQVQIS